MVLWELTHCHDSYQSAYLYGSDEVPYAHWVQTRLTLFQNVFGPSVDLLEYLYHHCIIAISASMIFRSRPLEESPEHSNGDEVVAF